MNYIANVIPARIRYTGPHDTSNLYTEDDTNTIYLRGFQLTCTASSSTNKPLANTEEIEEYGNKTKEITKLNIQGHGSIVTKQYDDLIKVADVGELKWFERDGNRTNLAEKVNELYDISEAIHG